jgi:hypothetical protein
MPQQLKKAIKPCIAILLFVGIIFAVTGHIDRFLGSFGLAKINQLNEHYLEESFDKAFRGFLVLSAIKSGVAVLEGSEVGIGFNLEVGDIVQSIFDYVDTAWKTTLAAATVLLLMRLVLEAIQTVDHWFLFVGLNLGLVVFLFRWWLPKHQKVRHAIKECLLFVACLAVALYVLLPISVGSASYLSNRITRPLIEEAQSGFEKMEHDLTPSALNNRFFSAQEEESFWFFHDFKTKIENSKQTLLEMARWLKEITKDFAIWTIKLIAGYLFDCVVFPMAFFVLLYLMTKILLAYVFGISRRQSLKEDLSSILKTLNGGRIMERL